MELQEEENQQVQPSIFYIDIPQNSHASYHYYKQIVDKINEGNINPEGNLHHTPESMKIKLKLHQQRSLYEMIEKEKMHYRTSSGINMCVLSDKVGAGKSITILSLICNNKKIEYNDKFKNRFNVRPPNYGFYGFDYDKTQLIDTNLLVVPHGIYTQWCKYIENITDLKYYGVSNVNELNNLQKEKLSDYDIVIVKSTKYNDFMKKIYEDQPLEITTTDFRTEFFNMEDTTIDYSLKNNLYTAYSSFTSQTYGKKFFDNLKNIREKLINIDFEKAAERLEIVGDYMVQNLKKIKGPIFQRVIIDEANSIKIPNCQNAYGIFNWFITSSVNELLYPSGKKDWNSGVYEIISKGISGYGFIKMTFSDNCHESLSDFVQRNFLKNNNQFVEDSFNLPDPIFNKIECYTPDELKILKDVGLPEVINALNAGDKDTALKLVGCNISNEKNIVDKVLKKITLELKDKKSKLEEKNNEMVNIQQEIESLSIFQISNKEEIEFLKSKKYSLKNSIENIKQQIKEIDSKIESMRERITNFKEKNCPICADEINVPVLTPCCKNIFCLECITMSLKYNKDKCPLCREKINISQVTCISENKTNQEQSKKSKLPTKIESFISIIKNKPKGKFLVFSEFDNSFKELIEGMDNNDISWSNICGSGARINNIVKKYVSGEIKVLFLNAKHYGSGLNLQMSSDIIIYHKMTCDLEMQVIGRGQRLGRTEPLTVHKLCYENELYS
jgi:FtsZ-binding cell division protein ZapB